MQFKNFKIKIKVLKTFQKILFKDYLVIQNVIYRLKDLKIFQTNSSNHVSNINMQKLITNN